METEEVVCIGRRGALILRKSDCSVVVSDDVIGVKRQSPNSKKELDWRWGAEERTLAF